MITVIKKIIIIKEKEGKRQGKKKALVRRGSILGHLLQHYMLPLGHGGSHTQKQQKAFI